MFINELLVTAKKAKHLRYVLYPYFCGIKSIEFTEIIQPFSDFPLRFKDWDKDIEVGNFWQVVVLSTLAKNLQPKLIVEIGTGRGRSTYHLALNSPDDTQIITVDASYQDFIGEIFRGRSEEEKIQKVRADSQSFDFSPYYGKVDMVYVDGAHDFAGVLADTETAFKLVSPQGCIIWDDICAEWPDVAKALRAQTQRKEIRRIIGTSYGIYSERLNLIPR